MRLVGTVVCVALLAGASGASGGGLPGKEKRDFWDWLLAPHRAEVDLVKQKVAANLALAANQYASTVAFDVETGKYLPERAALREQLLGETEAMLRYALRLAPGDMDVRLQLATVLDEEARPAAQAALERYLRDEDPERVSPDARVRLARWYARQGRDGDAIVQLRLALGPNGIGEGPTQTVALVLLGELYMNDGRLAEAIDLLSSYTRGPQASLLPAFTLAVAYDRDEQVTRAHDTIERMLANAPRQDALYLVLHDEAGVRIPMVPAHDLHYFAALQLELLGSLPEARTEWLAYARAPGAPYAARARQHLADVERMMREQRRAPRVKAPRTTPPAPVFPQPPGWIGP